MCIWPFKNYYCWWFYLTYDKSSMFLQNKVLLHQQELHAPSINLVYLMVEKWWFNKVSREKVVLLAFKLHVLCLYQIVDLLFVANTNSLPLPTKKWVQCVRYNITSLFSCECQVQETSVPKLQSSNIEGRVAQMFTRCITLFFGNSNFGHCMLMIYHL